LTDWTLQDCNGGLDNDERIWAIDCNQLKITIERFYLLTGTYNSFESVLYVLRHMKFTLLSKNYEHVLLCELLITDIKMR